ncbi:hypothetical protein CTAYLR_009623 [Chrysophaeum taylorii]|uniref:SAP domain-containing protein n=1 Tax=Chrysophaeum taylorii TaxID=2483200 RepID=A0AAD7UKX3_9STRA|nr:hypothetical protein CTAYLR_009623 [Chrysophaeum taylorii]
MAEGTDYVGTVLDRLESLCDDYMAKARKLATDEHAILDEQVRHARKRLRGADGSSVPARQPLAERDNNEIQEEEGASKPGAKSSEARQEKSEGFMSEARAITEEFSFKDLQRELKARELKAGGKKHELKERLDKAIADELASAAAVSQQRAASGPTEAAMEEVPSAQASTVDANLDEVIVVVEELPAASPRRPEPPALPTAPLPTAAAPEPPRETSMPPVETSKPVTADPPAASVATATPAAAEEKPQAVVSTSQAPPRAGILNWLPSLGLGAPTEAAPPMVVAAEPLVVTTSSESSSAATDAPAKARPQTTVAAAVAAHEAANKPRPPTSDQPRPKLQSQVRVERDRLEEVRARQEKERELRREQQLAKERAQQERLFAEKKRKEAEEALKKAAAIKRHEEAEARRKQREDEERRRLQALKQREDDERKQQQQQQIFVKPSDADDPRVQHSPAIAVVPPAQHPTQNRLTPADEVADSSATLLRPLPTTTTTTTTQPKQRSPPAETYEISDREESTDDEEDEDARANKYVPTWAQGANLREALKRQADKDPSQFFSMTASSCNLNDIFKNSKHFKKRTSSQNWSQDLSTYNERQRYRVEMGFTPPK